MSFLKNLFGKKDDTAVAPEAAPEFAAVAPETTEAAAPVAEATDVSEEETSTV